MYHKIQITFDYGEIDIYRSWIMALFLLEDKDFKGYTVIVLNLSFIVHSNVRKFEKIWLSGTLINIQKPKVWQTDELMDLYIPPTHVEQGYKKLNNFTFTVHKLWPFFSKKIGTF
jgi:hypothetical protein